MEFHGLDTETSVFFYEQEFYVLSNFSSFEIEFNFAEYFTASNGRVQQSLIEEFSVRMPYTVTFKTAEHLYHWFKFPNYASVRKFIRNASSAHDAFKNAQRFKDSVREDWDLVKVARMLQILRLKATQHEYVSKKLKETGDRILYENSWRDSFWGWGELKTGQNMLGRCWMQVRTELFGVVVPQNLAIPAYYLDNAAVKTIAT